MLVNWTQASYEVCNGLIFLEDSSGLGITISWEKNLKMKQVSISLVYNVGSLQEACSDIRVAIYHHDMHNRPNTRLSKV